MKHIIYRLSAFVLMLSVLTGCGDFDDMNVDPNEPTDVPAEMLVTQAMFTLPNYYWSRGANFEFGMLFVQHFAQAEYTEEQRYIFQPTNFDGDWSSIYATSMADLKVARDMIDADEGIPAAQKANQLAVLDIMMSWGFMIATDMFGDIPYSEALQPDEFVQPAYDAQADVYAGIIETVSSAVSSINTGANGFSSSADIINNGDMDAWQKFGNALLLRMGMRIADANASLASSTVSAALSGNIISSVDEEITLVYRTEQQLANPFWFDASAAGGSRDDFRITEELVTTLQDLGDPRLAMYADTTATGEYIGMPFGLGDNQAFALKSSTSRFALSIRQPTAPAYIIRYSEVKFLEAEAIARNFVTGNPAAAYGEAVTAAMNEWGITDATAIADYIVANPYDVANWEESIGLQMWIALYTNGQEAWATWRRLDQPVLSPGPAATLPTIPVRALYPNDESATNQDNLGEVQYADALSTRLWWDVN